MENKKYAIPVECRNCTWSGDLDFEFGQEAILESVPCPECGTHNLKR